MSDYGAAEVDYVTVLPTMDAHKFLTVVMHYAHDDFVQTRISRPLPRPAATALAVSWAAALHLEVRL